MIVDSVQPYSVSALTQDIKLKLEGSYPRILVEGEVSNFRSASSGHWYFSLKDEHALIQLVMFRGSQGPVQPVNGQMVLARGKLSVYAQRGSYQLICASIEERGEGRILQMLEERKRRLSELFSSEHKKALPFFPLRVVVLSAETGAAVRDIIRVIKRRAAWLNVCVVNIPVQGIDAGPKIARKLRMAESLGDVIILSRGGGSLEDLLPFSDEELIHAIYQCNTPVISAVGHEIDWALSDFAADLRAPTPSAAAEMLCATAEELRMRVITAGRIIIQAFGGIRERLALALRPFRKTMLEESFRSCIHPHRLALDERREVLIQQITAFIGALRQRSELTYRALTACDPRAVLKRGYSIVRNTAGAIVSDSGRAGMETDITIEFHNGKIDAVVKKGSTSDLNIRQHETQSTIQKNETQKHETQNTEDQQ